MFEPEVDIAENSSKSAHLDLHTASAQQASPAPLQPCPVPQDLNLLQPSSALCRAETDGSSMEIEAAQRKLQEIEDRCETCMMCKNFHLTSS